MGRSSRSEGYALRGGRAGAERLRLLNRVKWPTTEPLLMAAGLRAGMSCLDVGCGSGDVTLKMATLVGAEGSVVGVDRDQSNYDGAHKGGGVGRRVGVRPRGG
jgi:2-polyprenyl-3-methyl-5-hydroxy-6-metoxy-1,4-benzoquinol methylase